MEMKTVGYKPKKSESAKTSLELSSPTRVRYTTIYVESDTIPDVIQMEFGKTYHCMMEVKCTSKSVSKNNDNKPSYSVQLEIHKFGFDGKKPPRTRDELYAAIEEIAS